MTRPLTRSERQELLALLEERHRRREAARVIHQRDAIIAKCQTLHGFIEEFWYVLEPTAPFVTGWGIKAMCRHLEAVHRGDIQNLLITVPPGMMKSLLVSVFFQAWEWGPMGRPDLRYLATSYSDANVTRDSGKVRKLVESPKYQALWGDKVQKAARWGVYLFENTRGGSRDCRPFGSLTGGRGDRVLVDDPHSVDSADSEVTRASEVTTFREGATDRLNDITTSATIVIMQRLHQEDVAGTILKLGIGYVHLNLPMEFVPEKVDENGRCRFGPCRTYVKGELFFEDPRVADGELLFPERFPADALERLKRAKGAYAWAGQYQQDPQPRDGSFFEEGWFRRYRPGDIEGMAFRKYITSDHAPTAGPKSDANGARVWGVDASGDIWMLDGRKGRMRMDELVDLVIGNLKDQHRPDGRPKVEGLVRKHKPFAWFPENDNNWKAVEPFVLRRIREENVFIRIEPISPNGMDKATRAQASQAMAASNRVWIPEGAEGDEIIAELTAFPAGAHDEEVDLLSIIGRAIDMAHPAIVDAPPPPPSEPRGIGQMTWDQAMQQLGQPKRERV